MNLWKLLFQSLGKRTNIRIDYSSIHTIPSSQMSVAAEFGLYTKENADTVIMPKYSMEPIPVMYVNRKYYLDLRTDDAPPLVEIQEEETHEYVFDVHKFIQTFQSVNGFLPFDTENGFENLLPGINLIGYKMTSNNYRFAVLLVNTDRCFPSRSFSSRSLWECGGFGCYSRFDNDRSQTQSSGTKRIACKGYNGLHFILIFER